MNAHENLFNLISQGKIEKVKAYIQEFPDAVNFSNENGVSAVLYCFYVQEPAIGDYLIHQGANVGIFEASASGMNAVLKNILQQEPQMVNSFSNDGFQPLGYSCFFGQTETAKILVDAGAEINSASKNSFMVMPIHSAVANQNIETTRLLLKNGAIVNAVQAGGFTVLHSAAQNGQIEMVKLLIEAGANPTAKNHEEFTPLDLARRQNHLPVVNLLQKFT
jgi:ankyrin repeat protein